MRRFIATAGLLVMSLAIAFAQQQQQPQQQQKPQPSGSQPQGQQPPEGRGQAGRQGGQGQGRQGQGRQGAPAKPIVPLAASTIVNNPDPYIGQYVSVTAAVEAPLTGTSFSVDQDKTKTDKEILVIAPTMTGTVEANAYVTVLGELVKFDPEEIKKKTKNYTLDLSPEVVAKYQGKPAVVATAVVVNSTGIDIAKVLPPPLTPEEEAFQKIMKQVGPANTALRGAIDKMDAGAVKDQTAILAKAFTQTEAFWKTRGKQDAIGFAAEAKKHTDAIGAAAAAGKWDEAKAAAGPLGQQCQSCHTAHRERLDDGSFRIKTGDR
jgi:cytochrome c556